MGAWRLVGAGSGGHGCPGDEGYLCKSPSLASKKFTVYLTDLAIRIRISNVSCKMTGVTQLVLQCHGRRGKPQCLPLSSRPGHGTNFCYLAKSSLPFSDLLGMTPETADYSPQNVLLSSKPAWST